VPMAATAAGEKVETGLKTRQRGHRQRPSRSGSR